MAADAVDRGRVLWRGTPQEVRLSPFVRTLGLLAYGVGVVAIAFGVVQATLLASPAVGPLGLALWSVTVGALIHSLPALWQGGAKYQITTEHVIWSKGPFVRAIERQSINFARIKWNPKHPQVGSLELVRAVPVGVLRRRLSIRFESIEHPDAVWAIIRDAQSVASSGHGELPVSQRLDQGERILWTARPLPSLRAYLPSGGRQWYLLAVALTLFAIAGLMATRSVTLLERLSTAGISPSSLPFVALGTGLLVGVSSVVAIAFFIAHTVVLYHAFSLRETRYLISNKRVLIQCGRDELHIERHNIVDIIDTPAGDGRSNLFLVLDGPRSRALAANGAFGAEPPHDSELWPIFECVQDSDGAKTALTFRTPSLPPLNFAA